MSNIYKILKDVQNVLEYHQLMGTKEIPVIKNKRSKIKNQIPSGKGQETMIEPRGKKQETGDSKQKLLDELKNEIGNCTHCKLCKGRTNLVFGVGNPQANLMFIGEGPGRDEDLQGEPFVGRAGQLLTKIIEAMGLKRSDVYIANVVKCRPPENRNPEPDEIAACIPFLQKQIEIICPKAIVCLGKVAVSALLNLEVPISKFRGQMKEFCDIPLMPTYHPAYLLRNPAAKKDVWEDMKKVMEILKS